MPGDHARLAPSSAHIWGAPDGCRAYPAMSARFPENEESEAAREGTTAHWYASEVLQGRNVEEGDICKDTGMPVTADMAEGAERFITDAQEYMNRFEAVVEQRVVMPAIHPDNWGRCDFGGVNRQARNVVAWDFKFGYRPVEAVGNMQGLDYLDGVCNHFNVPLEQGWTFEVRIYQPRDYVTGRPVKVWNLTYEEFRTHRAALHVAALEASDPNAPARSGRHCMNCSAIAGCKAGQLAAIEVAGMEAANPLDMEQAGALLTYLTQAADRIEALKDGLAAQCEQGLRSGQRVPGWDLQAKYGRTRWSRPIPEVLALGMLYGKDLSKADAITPKQAIKAGIDETVIAAYSETPSAGFKLVPSDNGAKAARVFNSEETPK